MPGACAELSCRPVDEECVGVAKLSSWGIISLSCLSAILLNDACAEAILGLLGLLKLRETLGLALGMLALHASLLDYRCSTARKFSLSKAELGE